MDTDQSIQRLGPSVTPVSSVALPLPLPRVPITVRAGTLDDVPFIDGLQRLHTKQVGWMPTAQFEGKIKLGHVLVAESFSPRSHGGTENSGSESKDDLNSSSVSPCLRGERVGYVIGNDRYFKRDDVGVVYQMNVVPGRQRGLVGATLLRAQFERSAYGCRLYCCWCAQDIAANRFWEAMGFVPLAFRAGSEKRSRVHIFWQKRIVAGDAATPWWFPSQTSGGSIREDRIVLPIPPGTHWSDAKPMILPGMAMPGEAKQLDAPRVKRPKIATPAPAKGRASGGLRFAPVAPPVTEKPPRESKAKQKNDPRLVAAARELRDRWLEQVNATPFVGVGKYDVCRAISASIVTQFEPLRLLEAA